MRLRLREVKQLRPSRTAGNGKYTKMLIVMVICGQYNDGFFFHVLFKSAVESVHMNQEGKKPLKKRGRTEL